MAFSHNAKNTWVVMTEWIRICLCWTTHCAARTQPSACAVAVAAAGVAYARVEMGLGWGLRWALGWRLRSVLRWGLMQWAKVRAQVRSCMAVR